MSRAAFFISDVNSAADTVEVEADGHDVPAFLDAVAQKLRDRAAVIRINRDNPPDEEP